MKTQNEKSQDRYQIWMQNSGYLYDRLVVHKMAWPSLTFQWLPTIISNDKGSCYQVITGTHKSGAKQNHHNSNPFSTKMQYVYIQSVFLPEQANIKTPIQNKIQENIPLGPKVDPAQVHITQKFKGKYQANRARYFQLDPSLIAVRYDDAPISIFKRGKQSQEQVLKDHPLSEGFALQWSANGVISGDHDGNIIFWPSIQQNPYKHKYEDKVQDVKILQNNSFISVGDDGYMCIWDGNSGKIQNRIFAGSNQKGKQLYSVSINPQNNHLILTAGEEGVIKLWDRRNYKEKLYKFQGHEASILNVQWSSYSPTIFASGGTDSKVKIWDLLRVGFQIPKDNNCTQQLLFTHEGHRGDVLDLGWNPYQMLLGSTEQEYNSLQIYEISNFIQELEHAQDMEYLRMQCLS